MIDGHNRSPEGRDVTAAAKITGGYMARRLTARGNPVVTRETIGAYAVVVESRTQPSGGRMALRTIA